MLALTQTSPPGSRACLLLRVSLGALALASLLAVAPSTATATHRRSSSTGSATRLVWDEPVSREALRSLKQSTPGRKVLWWNIQYGALNKTLAGRELDTNLQRLARSRSSPDVVALGEFEFDALRPATMAALKRAYPTHKYVAYSETSTHRGVMVFSKQPFSEIKIAPIDYTPPHKSDEAQARYRSRWLSYDAERYFKRQFIRLTLKNSDGSTLNLIPIHTAQPWDKIERDHKSGFIGKLHAGLAMVFGRNNPLVHQLRRFRGELEERFESSLVFGDLNLVSHVGPVKTVPFKIVSKGLVDAFARRGAPTYPAASAPAFGSFHLQIDHFLATPDLDFQGAYVLPLKGSDHYPILMTGLRSKAPN